MENKNKINIAQIGIGYWGPNLLRNLVGNRNCLVSKVVDLSEERRDFVKKLYPSISLSGDIQDIIDAFEKVTSCIKNQPELFI